MAYVITDPCVSTCDTACVKVCPVDCIQGDFRLGNRKLEVKDLDKLKPDERLRVVKSLQLYIDPDTCIDCAACEPECPVDAIFVDSDVPANQQHHIKRNADHFRR
jgi:NAD-dependent dihydropyrimidine dehydrogenase PreA subunit